ncbi:hypothetical protein NIIDNTM18_49840 [Mycolicibacterium litorale]|uniref:HTH cro/C1-type domain-containing protein n=1 Tax=Mycolicibacterium litorale TaxID=758802 RepID=A0A6S6PCH9_9MYCO|nr:helix-turn-helix transcriptional regulator [Mycolicibacterium litorale]BCI55706.1 hypothetical protein NIIDNTM18_49840 [Mycolicibacterium litorale]
MARTSEEKWEPLDSLGTSGETVAKNIRRIRTERGLPYTELAERLERVGREIPTWGLRKIESGGRRVDVDDLMALASVLGVSPVTFLMPARKDDGSEVTVDDHVPITGWRKPISARWVWGWLTAGQPLIHGTLGSFVALAWPSWEREQFDMDVYQQIEKQKMERAYRGSNGND